MFYAYECLTKRGKFATIWLALNKKGKLPKQKCLSVDVSKACTDLVAYVPRSSEAARGPRFSLYLCAQLTHGILLVYDRQVCFLLADVKGLHESVRHPLPEPRPAKALGPHPVASDHRLQLNDSSHSSSNGGVSVDTGRIWAPDRPTDTNILAPEFIDDYVLIDNIVVQSSTDPSGDPTRSRITADSHDQHQARVVDITIPDALPDLRPTFDPDMDFPPATEEELRITEALAGAGADGQDPLRPPNRDDVTPDKVVHSSDGSAPNAPPRSLTPPLEEAERTAVGPHEQNSEGALPSIALRLDQDVDVPSRQPRRKRPVPGAAPPQFHLDASDANPADATRHDRPSVRLNLTGEQYRNQMQDFSDVIFQSEAERTAADPQAYVDESFQAKEAIESMFKPEKHIPGTFLAHEFMKTLEAREQKKRVEEKPMEMALELVELWRAAAADADEAPRTLADVQDENPWALEAPADETLHLDLTETQPPPLQLTELMADTGLVMETTAGMEEGGRGEDRNSDLNLDGRRSSLLDGEEGEVTAMDLDLAVEKGVISRAEADMGLGQEAKALPDDNVYNFVLSANEVLQDLKAMALAQEETEEEREELNFDTLIPQETTHRAKAAKYFFALLGYILPLFLPIFSLLLGI